MNIIEPGMPEEMMLIIYRRVTHIPTPGCGRRAGGGEACVPSLTSTNFARVPQSAGGAGEVPIRPGRTTGDARRSRATLCP